MMKVLAGILIIALALALLHWSGFGLGPWGFPLLAVVVLVCLIVWIIKGAPMPS